MTRAIHRIGGTVGAALLAAAPALAAEEHGGGVQELLLTAGNLVILLAVLIYFGRKPIRSFFADRRSQIQGEIETAERLRAEVESRYAEWQRRLVDLDSELDTLRTRSRERAEAERDRILADASASAERIRRDAVAAIEQELRRARDELREEAAALALQLAEDLLRENVDDADRERLVDEFIARVERPSEAGR